MLAKVVHELTQITDNNTINLENYMESINFINNVYLFINKIKMVTPISTIHFQPSFKGKTTCEKFNIESSEKENEMKYFVTTSTFFLEDKESKKELVRLTMGPICESIDFDGATIRFILK